jgi:hypothetical protein
MQVADVEAVLIRVLAPVVGQHMAGAAVRSHIQKQGLNGTPTAAQLDTLLGNLGIGLNIFVGREKSVHLVAEMRAALDAQGKAP